MGIWHLKDAAQIVLLALTFGRRIYSAPVISLGKHPSRPFSSPATQTQRRSGVRRKAGLAKPPPICPKQMMWLLVARVALVLPCRAASAPVLFLQAVLGARQATATSECW